MRPLCKIVLIMIVISVLFTSCYLFEETEREPRTGQNYLLIGSNGNYRGHDAYTNYIDIMSYDVNNYTFNSVTYDFNYGDNTASTVLDISDNGRYLLLRSYVFNFLSDSSLSYDSTHSVLDLYDLNSNSNLWSLHTLNVQNAKFIENTDSIIYCGSHGDMTINWYKQRLFKMNFNGTGIYEYSDALLSYNNFSHVDIGGYTYYISNYTDGCTSAFSDNYEIYRCDHHGENITRITNNEDVETCFSVSAENNTMCVVGSKIYTLDLTNGMQNNIVVTDYTMYSRKPPIFSLDGSFLWVEYRDRVDGFLQILYNTETNTVICDSLPLFGAAFSPDNKYLFYHIEYNDADHTYNENGGMYRYDLQTNTTEFLDKEIIENIYKVISTE